MWKPSANCYSQHIAYCTRWTGNVYYYLYLIKDLVLNILYKQSANYKCVILNWNKLMNFSAIILWFINVFNNYVILRSVMEYY